MSFRDKLSDRYSIPYVSPVSHSLSLPDVPCTIKAEIGFPLDFFFFSLGSATVRIIANLSYCPGQCPGPNYFIKTFLWTHFLHSPEVFSSAVSLAGVGWLRLPLCLIELVLGLRELDPGTLLLFFVLCINLSILSLSLKGCVTPRLGVLQFQIRMTHTSSMGAVMRYIIQLTCSLVYS